jgi:hypothetical protein
MNFQDRLKQLEAKLDNLNASEADDFQFEEVPASALEEVHGGGSGRDLDLDLGLLGGSRPRALDPGA